MKKLIKIATGIVASVALMAGSAMAGSYELTMCGASAQAGFWQTAGTSVLESDIRPYKCTSAQQLTYEGSEHKFYVLRGTGCTVADDTDATIYLTYRSVSSGHGCDNFGGAAYGGWPDPSTCAWDDGNCDTPTTGDRSCMLGCADVPCDTLDAETTNGWYAGYSDWRTDFDNYVTNGWDSTLKPTGIDYPTTPVTIDENTDEDLSGVIVPFGFIVNNKVTQSVCNYDGVNENAKLAYDKRGWACENTAAGRLACAANYKCIDGFCADGNNNVACEDASGCTMGDEANDSVIITCDKEPLKNISRLMALHIFSGAVDNWADFGASFDSMPIVQCMRHAGSGTHQTLVDTVFRGDTDVKTTTTVNYASMYNTATYAFDKVAESGPHTFHYKSSSSLTKDCVARFDGGIGYVDADKAIATNINTSASNGEGIHQLMYQGSAPSRQSVTSGEYNYWAAQTCYYKPAQVEDTLEGLLLEIVAEAGNPDYLTLEKFGERAHFWATSDEMLVEKEGGDPSEYPKSTVLRDSL